MTLRTRILSGFGFLLVIFAALAAVVILVTPEDNEVDEALRLRLRHPSLTVIVCGPRGGEVVSQPLAGTTVLRAGDASDLVDGWTAAHGRRSATNERRDAAMEVQQ